MPLYINNPEVERLVAEVAQLTGQSKTEAIRQALSERLQRIRMQVEPGVRSDRLERFLGREVWSRVPEQTRAPNRSEREEILGIGPEGV